MKTIAIETETRPPSEWLPVEDTAEVIYLTRGGRTRFVIVPLDEGDEEALAVQRNPTLMNYITGCIERAHKGPTKTLAQLRGELNAADDAPP